MWIFYCSLLNILEFSGYIFPFDTLDPKVVFIFMWSLVKTRVLQNLPTRKTVPF